MTYCALIETAQYSLRTSPRSYSHRRKSSCQILTTQLDSVSNLIKISSPLNKIYPWGAGMHSHLTNVAWVRFRFGANCGLLYCWLSLCAEDFFSGFSGFSPPQKPTSPNSNSTRIKDPREKPTETDVAPSLKIINLFSLSWMAQKQTNLLYSLL